MENFVKEHPKSATTALLLFLGSFLIWLDVLGDVWSSFSSTPLFQGLKNWWPGMTPGLYMGLTLALRLCILGLLVMVFFRVRQQRKEAELLEELQTKLSALEDKQPYLEVRCVHEARFLATRESREVEGYASFALLRITNTPKSQNSQAIALRLYAWVSYCDHRGNDLFPPVKGAWFSLGRNGGIDVIDYTGEEVDRLDPHHSVYLGIALKCISPVRADRRKCYGLDVFSSQYKYWINSDYQLPERTINIKVMVGYHNFQTTLYYALNSYNNDIQPRLVTPPTAQWSRFWPILLYFINFCFHLK